MNEGSKRKTSSVLKKLIGARIRTMKRYPPGVEQTAHRVADLLPKIAAFPVGTGLAPEPWPESFPEQPVLFVGHNWGNARMLKSARKKGGEGHKAFWRR